MRHASQGLSRQLPRRLIEHADLLDQVPRELTIQQEFGLLLLLRRATGPLVRLDGAPVDLAELAKVTAILEIMRPRVGKGERPTPLVGLCPGDDRVQVRDQMHDRVLPALVGELGVPAMDEEEHHRARTEIERHALTYIEVGMAGERQLVHPPRLDVVHADDRAVGRALGHHRVGKQEAFRRDRRQLVHVDNVIELGVGGGRHRRARPSRSSRQHPPDRWCGSNNCVIGQKCVRLVCASRWCGAPSLPSSKTCGMDNFRPAAMCIGHLVFTTPS
jgi:hypothetical protein